MRGWFRWRGWDFDGFTTETGGWGWLVVFVAVFADFSFAWFVGVCAGGCCGGGGLWGGEGGCDLQVEIVGWYGSEFLEKNKKCSLVINNKIKEIYKVTEIWLISNQRCVSICTLMISCKKTENF